MKIHTHLTRLAASLFIFHFSLFIGTATLHAQAVAQPELQQLSTTGTISPSPAPIPVATTPATARAPADDDIVEMSVFNVNADTDEGYQAMNTASGSRINTALRDTAASISPFTAEFLSDVGAATIEDMLSFGANIEAIGEDDLTGGFNPEMSAAVSDNNFRIRGMTMTTAMDGVETNFQMDMYNIDRAEISSGPNSILFGMGQPGGMVTLASKRANLQRRTLRVQNVFGTWINPGKPWNYYRATFDYNIPLMPRTLAFRLMGIYQDGANSSWRYWLVSRDKRINPVITFRPWRSTTINIAYEAGHLRNTPTIAWNAADRVSAWLHNDRPLQPTFNGPNLPGTGKINSNGNNPYYVFVDNNQELYDFRQALQSNSMIAGTNANQARLPAELSSYYYSIVGPGGRRDQRFDRYQFVIEQRLGPVNIQLGYYHTKNNALLHGLSGYEVALRGDPNKYISGTEWLGAAGTVENPFMGRLYMEEQNWETRQVLARNDAFRLTAEYSVNLKKYGRHRIITFLERAHIDNRNIRKSEIFVDENQVGITTGIGTASGNNPYNSNNLVYRRHYVDEGDFRTYYGSTWETPIQEFTLDGQRYHTQYVTRSLSHVKRRVDAATLSLQSFWFNDRLVTVFGGRFNDNSRQNERNSRITDLNDPRLLDRSMVYREQYLDGRWRPHGRDVDGEWVPYPHRRPKTYSAGGVWHVNNRLSVFANTSSNRTDDATDQSILGGTPPPSEGYTTDYGVMFNVTGDGRVFLRLTHFNTQQINAIASYNNNQIIDTSDRLQAIYSTLLRTGVISPEEYAARPRGYNSGMSDVYARGYEAELTIRFSKRFNLRFAGSYTDRARENIFKEIFEHYASNVPYWMMLADPRQNGGNNVYLMDDSGLTLHQYLLSQLYSSSGSVRDSLSGVLLQQSGGMSSRPFKFNVTARYNFPTGLLKGLNLGGSVRYSDPNRIPDPHRVSMSLAPVTKDDYPKDLQMDVDAFTNYATMMKGSSLLFYDLFANYRLKVFGGRTTMTLQLNIRNLLNQNVVTSARYNLDTNTGYAFLRRVYLNDPRSIRITATFDF